jgi:hypothetical protein
MIKTANGANAQRLIGVKIKYLTKQQTNSVMMAFDAHAYIGKGGLVFCEIAPFIIITPILSAVCFERLGNRRAGRTAVGRQPFALRASGQADARAA